MKMIGARNYHRPPQSGMTVIEMSLTLALMISFAGAVAYSLHGVGEWRKAREASTDLRSVYVAQKAYMADNPTADISTVLAADLVPYLPSGITAIPSVTALDGSSKSIIFTVMPPVVENATTPYDPSGASDDGLWDVGDL